MPPDEIRRFDGIHRVTCKTSDDVAQAAEMLIKPPILSITINNKISGIVLELFECEFIHMLICLFYH